MRHCLFSLIFAVSILMILTACSREGGDVADEMSPHQAAPTTASDEVASTTSPSDQPPTEAAVPSYIIARGAAAWKQGNCTMCHGADGRGNRFGPDLTVGQWNNCDGSVAGIRRILVAGITKEQITDTSYAMAMPSASKLITNEDDLDALAEYVKSLSSETSSNE